MIHTHLPSVARVPNAAGGLAALRRRIAALERRSSAAGPARADGLRRPWRLGVAALDAALPETASAPEPESESLQTGGLAPSGLHEAAGASEADGPAAFAFLAVLLARLGHAGRRGPVAVCQDSRGGAGRQGRLYEPGWRDLGLDPATLVVVEAARAHESLWAMEECLRSGALAAVLGEAEGLTFTASLRLALAAREGGTPLLLLRGDGLDGASAAFSRWRVTALVGGADPFDAAAPGPPRWRLELRRCRGGRPATCIVEWNRETAAFDMAAALGNRPAAPCATCRHPGLMRAAG